MTLVVRAAFWVIDGVGTRTHQRPLEEYDAGSRGP